MKINIKTFFYGNNYGALLQSYTLKSFINKNCEGSANFSRYQPKKFLYREEFKPLVTKNIVKFFLKLKKFYKLRKWKTKYICVKPKIIKENFNNDKSISIYGSDEILNFANPFFGYDAYFFGKNDRNNKLSYAASFGASSSLTISKLFKEELKKYFDEFSFISVRDYSSYKFLKNNLNIDSEIVLDPVFLKTNDPELNNFSQNSMTESKFCLVYGQFFSKQQIVEIKKFSLSQNIKTISVGYHNSWCDKNYLDANPFEFLNILYFSNYVFTSMFHGVMLSLKYNKQFWYTEDPYRKNKLDFLSNKLKINNRIILTQNNFEKTLDYTKINEEINKLQKSSEEFILSSIKRFKQDN